MLLKCVLENGQLLCDFYLNKSKIIVSTLFNNLEFGVISKEGFLQVLRDEILPGVSSYYKRLRRRYI